MLKDHFSFKTNVVSEGWNEQLSPLSTPWNGGKDWAKKIPHFTHLLQLCPPCWETALAGSNACAVLDLGASVLVVNEKSPDKCPSFMPFSSPPLQKVLYHTEESQDIRKTGVKASRLKYPPVLPAVTMDPHSKGTPNKMICCYNLHWPWSPGSVQLYPYA